MKRTFRSNIISFLIAASCFIAPVAVFTGPLWMTGCTTVAEGNDPLVVEAERDIKSAFYLADSFVTWEHQNRTGSRRDITEAADRVRRDFKQWHETAVRLVRTYKANRTPENKANLDTVHSLLLQVVAEMRRYLPPEKVRAAQARAAAEVPKVNP